MQQPQHDLRPFQVNYSSPRRYVSFALVAALHILVIWALASGLAASIVKKLPSELKTEVVQQKPQEVEKPPPPPPPDLTKPPPPFVPPPDIIINSPAPSNAISDVQSKSRVPAHPQIAPPTPKGRSHDCQAGYPPVSKRLGEEGRVLIKFVVTEDGRTSNVSVMKSSGYPRLDAAAVQCASSWRYNPATQLGRPIAVTQSAIVKYQLR